MKKSFFLKIIAALTAIIIMVSCGEKKNEITYTTGEWNADSLGYHRIVLRVSETSDAVWAKILWRRRDISPELKGMILVDGTTGKRIVNFASLSITRESGDIIFQPVSVPGDYYLYYLPGKPARKSNYPRVTYPGPFNTADPVWISKYLQSATGDLVAGSTTGKAMVISIQSRDQFNSFYPMEVIATRAETENLIAGYPDKDFLLFTEDRLNSIRMKQDLPMKWITDKPQKKITGKVLKGEYFTFQLGVYPVKGDLTNLKVVFSDLIGNDGKLKVKADDLTCFNTGGRNWDNSYFSKQVDVKKGNIQALWCGVMIPEDLRKMTLTGTVTVTSAGMKPESADIKIEVLDKQIPNHGDNDPFAMTRLRWLNSDLAVNDDIVKPFTPVKRNGNEMDILGRKLVISENGLPSKYISYFSPDVTSIDSIGKNVLTGPVTFQVINAFGTTLQFKNNRLEFTKENQGITSWISENSGQGFDLNVEGSLEADGFAQVRIMLIAKEKTSLSNTHLLIPVSNEFSRYMMGLGLRGGLRPYSHRWKWDRMLHQEGAWIGGVNGGIQFALRDNKYVRPLNTNFYRDKPLIMPESWFNEGKGGIEITSGYGALVDNYTGPREVKAGDTLHFYVNFLLTPFKPIDTDKQWATRFYHSYKPVDTIKKYGANTINIHHANEINPWINYPFLVPDKMKAYIDEAHSKGMKVKIYNTVRELSNHAAELFAIRSLGHEIFSPGPGNGFNWLQEHLVDDYIAAWFVPDLKDAAIINSGMSRWHNYYIEGMNWLTKEVGIDGLYLDDVAFDRTTMKRLRKVLDANRDGALIDLHSANQYNVRDGFTNSANLYMEHFPYLNRLWFGEYFDRNLPPDFWLVEMSGIPFGLMGEMLQDGGNQYRGMLYGMTSRAPWSGDPASLWKAWDDFGMAGTAMTGYWSENCPVTTGYLSIPATVYRKEGMALIAVASWDSQPREIALQINWERLGINPANCEMIIPEIKNFQEGGKLNPGETITIKPAEGKIIIVKTKQ